MNLTNPNILIAILSIVGVILIVLLAMIIKMHLKMKRFLIDIDAHNIADSLQSVSSDLQDIEKFRAEMDIYLKSVEERLKRSIQSVHTIRFNPFAGTGEGGNQSFATVFLNENGDGAVMSSLFTRDRVSVFSKSLKNFISEHGMSDEEKEALVQAKRKLEDKFSA
jgi:hypothetical protein